MLMEWITIIIYVNDLLFPLPEVLRDDIAYSITRRKLKYYIYFLFFYNFYLCTCQLFFFDKSAISNINYCRLFFLELNISLLRTN